MSRPTRRQFLRRIGTTLGSAAALNAFPPSIQKALAIAADKRSGTIEDVDHIVLLMMENRSFDHYFGSMNGVRGFADRFPIPLADAPGRQNKTVWYQRDDAVGAAGPSLLAPQRLDTTLDFALLRSISTPHTYPNAQDAWDHGRMARWPQFKTAASMVYFTESRPALPVRAGQRLHALRRQSLLDDRRHQSESLLLLHWHEPGPRRGGARRLQRPGRQQRLQRASPRGRCAAATHGRATPSDSRMPAFPGRSTRTRKIDFYSLNPLLGLSQFPRGQCGQRAGRRADAHGTAAGAVRKRHPYARSRPAEGRRRRRAACRRCRGSARRRRPRSIPRRRARRRAPPTWRGCWTR